MSQRYISRQCLRTGERKVQTQRPLNNDMKGVLDHLAAHIG